MKAKLLEIRDTATCMHFVAFRPYEPAPNRSEMCKRDLMEQIAAYRHGWHTNANGELPHVILVGINGTLRVIDSAHVLPLDEWSAKAIELIRLNWDKIRSGDVIDIRVVRGERAEPALSELFHIPERWRERAEAMPFLHSLLRDAMGVGSRRLAEVCEEYGIVPTLCFERELPPDERAEYVAVTATNGDCIAVFYMPEGTRFVYGLIDIIGNLPPTITGEFPDQLDDGV